MHYRFKTIVRPNRAKTILGVSTDKFKRKHIGQTLIVDGKYGHELLKDAHLALVPLKGLTDNKSRKVVVYYKLVIISTPNIILVNNIGETETTHEKATAEHETSHENATGDDILHETATEHETETATCETSQDKDIPLDLSMN